MFLPDNSQTGHILEQFQRTSPNNHQLMFASAIMLLVPEKLLAPYPTPATAIRPAQFYRMVMVIRSRSAKGISVSKVCQLMSVLSDISTIKDVIIKH